VVPCFRPGHLRVKRYMNIMMVAKRARVSPSTVARVINDHPLVTPETAERVRQVMRELDYVPPVPAKRRGPRTERNQGFRTRNIAHLVVGMDSKQMRSVITPGAVAESLANHGLNLIFIPMPDPDKVPPIINLKHVDGVIIQGLEPLENAAKVLRELPIVWMMTRRSDRFWADYVQPDNEANGRMAAEHLLAQGHQHLGIIDLQPNYPAFELRSQAFVRFARARGATVHEPQAGLTNPSPVLHTGSKDVQAYIEGQARHLIEASPRPTGLYLTAALELTALELFTIFIAFQKRGLELGKDVSLVAGDYSPEWLSKDNLLSACIDIQLPAIAERAVEQLIWRIQHPDAPGPVGVSMPPRLVLPTA